MLLLMYCSFAASAKAKARTFLTRKADAAAFKAKTFKGTAKTKAKAGILWPRAKA